MGRDESKPMSRFWSCFFAGGLLALFWTLPMKKSLKWLAIQGAPFATFSLLVVLGLMPSEPIYDSSNLSPSPIIDFVSPITGLAYIVYIHTALICWPISIYFMYRWVTTYNLEKFGYKNRAEWEKIRQDKLE